MEKIFEIRDLNLGAFLLTKGFAQATPPRLASNQYHLIRSFRDTPELQTEIDRYYRHESLVEPCHFQDNVRSSKNLAAELRRITPNKGGDLQ